VLCLIFELIFSFHFVLHSCVFASSSCWPIPPGYVIYIMFLLPRMSLFNMYRVVNLFSGLIPHIHEFSGLCAGHVRPCTLDTHLWQRGVRVVCGPHSGRTPLAEGCAAGVRPAQSPHTGASLRHFVGHPWSVSVAPSIFQLRTSLGRLGLRAHYPLLFLFLSLLYFYSSFHLRILFSGD